MSRAKAKYQKKPFESTGISSDTSANIYMSMLLSDAWRDLTAKQHELYLYCKAQYYAEKQKPNGDDLCFTMNMAKWNKLYCLYTKANREGFYRDMDALIAHGFIVCVECGAATRTKSVYKFSSMWQHYGTEKFSVSKSEMSNSLKHKTGTENA